MGNSIWKNNTVQSNNQKSNGKKQKIKVIVITVAVLMSLGLIALAVALGVIATKNETLTSDKSNIKLASFAHSYYDVVEQTSDMKTKIDKILVSNEAKMQNEMLYDLWKSCELTQRNLSNMSSQDAGVNRLQQFVNQLGDFSHSIAMSHGTTELITSKEQNTFNKEKDILDDIVKALGKVQYKVENGEFEVNFENMSKEIKTIFTNFTDPSVDYPKMIYDGPFSDSLKDVKAKFLKGNKITPEKGKDILMKNLTKGATAKYVGDGFADLETFNYAVELNGKHCTFQLTKDSGVLLLMTANRQVGKKAISEDEGVKKALHFAEQFGFPNMQSVWITSYDNIFYVNLAPVENGIILYPDLIKIKVASDNGDILGLDSRNYIYNHENRNLSKDIISVQDAESKLKENSKVTSKRLTLVPISAQTEKLCYEFCMQKDGYYFVYIDAHTGEEVKILFVVDSQNGRLLV